MKYRRIYIIGVVLAAIIVFYADTMTSGRQIPAIRMKLLQTIGSDSDFIRIGEVATDSSNNIFVTDGLQFTVKEFSSGGKYVGQFGRRGTGEGDFAAFPSNITIYHDTITLVEIAAPILKQFSLHFDYIRSIYTGNPVVDFAQSKNGEIFVNQIANTGRPHIKVYSPTGDEIGTIPFDPVEKGDAFTMIHLAVDRQGRLILVHRFANLVLVFNPDYSPRNQFRVRELPDEATVIQSNNEKLGAIPQTQIINDIAVDGDDFIFILAGELVQPPNRNIFVYTIGGKYVTSFILPAESGMIYFDEKGVLYTRENHRTIVRKYQLVRDGFPQTAE